MNTDKTAIAERVRVLRAQRHIKQIEIADKTGIKRQTLSMIERGEQYPTIPQIVALADLFGVTIDYLACGNESERLSA
jgi:transcriptional regulator with XRE-family HTH domain